MLRGFVGAEFAAPASQPFRHPPEVESKVSFSSRAMAIVACTHRMPTSPPLPLRVAKAGRNHLNEEITPLLPLGQVSVIAKPYIKFRTCSALAPM
jgi:hypothetical protein